MNRITSGPPGRAGNGNRRQRTRKRKRQRQGGPDGRCGHGNLTVTHCTAAEAPADVWQASACREPGSWNQAVLAVPLCDTPMGTQLGAALICDRAPVDHRAAPPASNKLPASSSSDDDRVMFIQYSSERVVLLQQGWDARVDATVTDGALTNSYTVPAAAPEASTGAMMGLGLGPGLPGVGAVSRRRRVA